METIRKYGTAFGGSFIIASLANTQLFIAKESSPTLMDWMQQATGYQWLTHGVVVLLLFLLLGIAFAGFAPALARRSGAGSAAASIAASVLVGSALLIGLVLF